VLTFTSSDIERTGASDLGQLFQYIPAISSFTTGLGTDFVNGSIGSGIGSGQTQSRTTAQLRGGSETATLLLVDGKRVPLTGLRNAGGNGYDLGGIPLSAIDRVEVLLDGASAIYGADAIFGVINVILKKRYTGTEVKLSYDNTFDRDAAIKTASLTHGFAKGKWSGLVTVSGSTNNIMLLTDRYLTQSYNRTLYGGITDQSQPTLYVEGTGSLNVATGNLPGTTVPRMSDHLSQVPPSPKMQAISSNDISASGFLGCTNTARASRPTMCSVTAPPLFFSASAFSSAASSCSCRRFLSSPRFTWPAPTRSSWMRPTWRTTR
jgi:outer membrane receptor protein involved in Fe transport